MRRWGTLGATGTTDDDMYNFVENSIRDANLPRQDLIYFDAKIYMEGQCFCLPTHGFRFLQQ